MTGVGAPGPGTLHLATEVLVARTVNARVAIVKKLEQTINGLLRFEDAPGRLFVRFAFCFVLSCIST